jgi:hypothetical protein
LCDFTVIAVYQSTFDIGRLCAIMHGKHHVNGEIANNPFSIESEKKLE